jgi:hypothetical protein
MFSKDLTGTWHIYKYLYKNVDETSQFLSITDTSYYGYTITFTSGGQYTEKHISYITPVTINGNTYNDTIFNPHSGTWAFANNYNNLVLSDSVQVLNAVDTTLVYIPRQRTYTIFDLTGASVQLDTDTTQFYLAKNM